LPPPLEDFVRRKVQSGEFPSAEDVLCEGLRLLQQREAWVGEARRKIDEGWAQAKSDKLRSPSEVVQNLAVRKKAFRAHKG